MSDEDCPNERRQVTSRTAPHTTAYSLRSEGKRKKCFVQKSMDSPSGCAYPEMEKILCNLFCDSRGNKSIVRKELLMLMRLGFKYEILICSQPVMIICTQPIILTSLDSITFPPDISGVSSLSSSLSQPLFSPTALPTKLWPIAEKSNIKAVRRRPDGRGPIELAMGIPTAPLPGQSEHHS